jgi:hypothetical protein
MTRSIRMLLTAVPVVAVMILTGCSFPPASILHPGDPGYKKSFLADGVSFNMVHAPAKTFPADTNDKRIASVTDAYWIGETEVTYELWYMVCQWALSHNYHFANPGREGNDGAVVMIVMRIPCRWALWVRAKSTLRQTIWASAWLGRRLKAI